MISRRKIISRSQSELDYSHSLYEIEEDVWFSQDKLYQDHITEILRKWDQIDDEIWGKIICMERNRRIAKAYSRVPVLTISGSEDGFDGYKIGLNGFDNPMRDALTKTVKSHIGKGVRLKMDDMGNIIIKRMSNCDVFIRGWDRESNSLSNDIVELSGELEFERSLKLFDMKKFQSNVARELRSSYPDRKKLESQCICAIAFVKDTSDLLDLCSWVLLINIVALDLLKSRFPAILQNREPTSVSNVHYRASAPKFVSIFDAEEEDDDEETDLTPSSRDHRRKIISDEDPYSVPLNPAFNSGSNTQQPFNNNVNSREAMRTSLENNIKNGKIPPQGRILMPSNNQSKNLNKNDPNPPELPPRDFAKIKVGKTGPGKPAGKVLSRGSRNVLPQAIRSLMTGKSNGVKNNGKASSPESSSTSLSPEEKRRQEIEYEDPYYCGLQARVPNFGGRNRKSIAVVPNSASRTTSGVHHHPTASASDSNYNNSSDLSSTGYGGHGQYGYTTHLPRVSIPSSSSNSNRHNNRHSTSSNNTGFGLHYHKPLPTMPSSSPSRQMEIRKSQSNGYLNSLFNNGSSSSERYATYWD